MPIAIDVSYADDAAMLAAAFTLDMLYFRHDAVS